MSENKLSENDGLLMLKYYQSTGLCEIFKKKVSENNWKILHSVDWFSPKGWNDLFSDFQKSTDLDNEKSGFVTKKI